MNKWFLVKDGKRADSSNATKYTKENAATVKMACVASLSAPFLPLHSTPLPLHYQTLGVKSLNVHLHLKAEILSYFDMTPSCCSTLHLMPRRPAEDFLVNLG